MLEFKPHYPHAILHDVSLKFEGVYFQMDSILISPASIIITEVKNFAEKIVVKPNPLQFIKEFPNGKRISMRSPITEIERKIHFLDSWLRKRNIQIPIKGIVAFAYNNELQIEAKPEMDIMFTYDVPLYLRSLNVDRQIISKEGIISLANEICKSHQEFNPFPMANRFDIDPSKIRPGVICPECGSFHMKWQDRRWYCHVCRYNGSNEHEEAMRDWFMLIKNTMTNREFRYFAQNDCRYVAKNLLRRSSKKMVGSGRFSHYEIELDKKSLH
ncbi:nuclease-related domain-containing protein [Sporosarcina thermotolerans]|uniref:nuclease-related domain-containing protein n=1 Tax=Sporosarcina thermotolerans TaxID=633404 RepID=UPI0024BCE7A5|nr:nuclease-related domain-containing protein [Sporosarcina thermotolerans]WHT48323.1 nuclease-related domain-containing protein [Sporosarcina thermotolerans]